MNEKYYVIAKCQNCGTDVHITKYRFAERKGIVFCRKCSINKTYKENPEKLEHAKSTRLNTVRSTYHCDNVAQCKEIQDKWVKTKLIKTGYKGIFDNPKYQELLSKNSHTAEAFEKRWDTYEKRTGYRHPMKNPEVKKLVLEKHTKRYLYNNTFFDSSWELAYYIYLLYMHIDFKYQPESPFLYIKDDQYHVYEPDFLIDGKYIEIKGGQFFNEKGEPWNKYSKEFWWEKYNCMLENNVEIMLENDIKKYVKFTKKLYGKNFFKDHRYSKNK